MAALPTKTKSLGENEMKPFQHFPKVDRSKIRFVLTDIDDTLTSNGRLPAAVFTAMESLQENGIRIIPITGRPAGWCDHIARMWPVDAIVGENGAFFFRYDQARQYMQRHYFLSKQQRSENRQKLEQIKQDVLNAVPGAAVSADQPYREADLAIDFCEDVPPLPQADIDKIVAIFEQAGAQAKASSIHVNGWFGDYDKLTMSQILLKDVFGLPDTEIKDQVLYIGDSPNDCPMFAFFPHSVGVANILAFKGRLEAEPAWVTQYSGGQGFAEMASLLVP
jgi:HAD superfamily hydrolase (TIGR01484 family)